MASHLFFAAFGENRLAVRRAYVIGLGGGRSYVDVRSVLFDVTVDVDRSVLLFDVVEFVLDSWRFSVQLVRCSPIYYNDFFRFFEPTFL